MEKDKQNGEYRSYTIQPLPFLVRLFARNNSIVALADKKLSDDGVDYISEEGYKKYLYLRGASLKDELQIRKVFCYVIHYQGDVFGELLQRFFRKEYDCAKESSCLRDYMDAIAAKACKISSSMELAAIYMVAKNNEKPEEIREPDIDLELLFKEMHSVEHPEPSQHKKRKDFPVFNSSLPLDIFAEGTGMSAERLAVENILRSEHLLFETFGNMDISKADNRSVFSCFDDILFSKHNDIIPGRHASKILGVDDDGDDEDVFNNAAACYAGEITGNEEDAKSFHAFVTRMLPHFFYLSIIKRMAKAYSREKDVFFSMEEFLLRKKESSSLKRKYEECVKEKDQLESKYSAKTKELQKKLNEIQIAFDKKKLALSDAEAELALLKQGFSELEAADDAGDADDESEVSTKEAVDIGDGDAVLLFGGHERFQQKYERRYPKIRTFSPHQDFDASVIKGARIILVNATHLTHKQFFKIINEVRKHKKKLVYVR